MPVPISNVTRRAVYAPSGAGGAGPYSFTFEILAAADIAVYKDDVLLTLTTHYTVTIASNGTGSVTITSAGLALAPVSPTQYAIVGNRTIQRTSDFVTGGDFFANTLNDELDQQTIFAQQNSEGLARALQAPQTDPTSINMTLPGRVARAGRYLSFDENGNPIPGPIAVNIEGISDIVDEIQVVADISTEVVNVAGQEANITTIAPIASSIATVASISSAVSSVAANMTDVQNAAENAIAAEASATSATASASSASTSASNAAASYDSFDDRYLGAKSTGPTLDNDGNALLTGALYWNTVNTSLYVWTGSVWDQAAFNITGTGVSSFNTRTGGVTLTSGDVTTALGFTPGDVTGPAASIDSELVLFNSTTGKLVKRASLTGLVKATSGVAAAATAGTDYLAPPSGTALLKANSGGALANATAGTDYVAPSGALGTPSSGTLSNCTVDGTDSVGFRNIPINSKSAAYTTVLADSGEVIFHPSTDANARTFTIDSNANVAYALGTAITFINMTSQVVTIAITSDTMYLAGTGTTGSRSLAQYGIATAIKMTSTTWIISGNGLT
jgi:hypothetical protein